MSVKWVNEHEGGGFFSFYHCSCKCALYWTWKLLLLHICELETQGRQLHREEGSLAVMSDAQCNILLISRVSNFTKRIFLFICRMALEGIWTGWHLCTASCWWHRLARFWRRSRTHDSVRGRSEVRSTMRAWTAATEAIPVKLARYQIVIVNQFMYRANIRWVHDTFRRSLSDSLITSYLQPSSCLSDKEEDEIYGFGYGCFAPRVGRNTLQSLQQCQMPQQQQSLPNNSTNVPVTQQRWAPMQFDMLDFFEHSSAHCCCNLFPNICFGSFFKGFLSVVAVWGDQSLTLKVENWISFLGFVEMRKERNLWVSGKGKSFNKLMVSGFK